MESLLTLDTEVFHWINQHYSTPADWILWTASQGWSWAIVLVIALVLTTLRKEPKRWWIVLIGIGLCFLLSDRISVMCFKDVFCRLRPCHALENVRMFRTSCGGMYGFVSSHAANVFALALFLTLRYRDAKHRWRHSQAKSFDPKTTFRAPMLYPTLMFIWAAIVGYSRVYLGKHYPGDVICGAALGIAVGLSVWAIVRWAEHTFEKKIERK